MDTQFRIRCTQEALARWHASADRLGVSLAELIRRYLDGLDALARKRGKPLGGIRQPIVRLAAERPPEPDAAVSNALSGLPPPATSAGARLRNILAEPGSSPPKDTGKLINSVNELSPFCRNNRHSICASVRCPCKCHRR